MSGSFRRRGRAWLVGYHARKPVVPDSGPHGGQRAACAGGFIHMRTFGLRRGLRACLGQPHWPIHAQRWVPVSSAGRGVDAVTRIPVRKHVTASTPTSALPYTRRAKWRQPRANGSRARRRSLRELSGQPRGRPIFPNRLCALNASERLRLRPTPQPRGLRTLRRTCERSVQRREGHGHSVEVRGADRQRETVPEPRHGGRLTVPHPSGGLVEVHDREAQGEGAEAPQEVRRDTVGSCQNRARGSGR